MTLYTYQISRKSDSSHDMRSQKSFSFLHFSYLHQMHLSYALVSFKFGTPIEDIIRSYVFIKFGAIPS